MKKLFDIPIYALDNEKLNSRVNKKIQQLKIIFSNSDATASSRAIKRIVFPMYNWEYNHIIGYIRIAISKNDILFDVFLPLPIPSKYVWSTTKKTHVQNIGTNGTHLYVGTLKNNEEIRTAIANMLFQIINEHIPSRFYVDQRAFDTINGSLDYLSIIESM